MSSQTWLLASLIVNVILLLWLSLTYRRIDDLTDRLTTMHRITRTLNETLRRVASGSRD